MLWSTIALTLDLTGLSGEKDWVFDYAEVVEGETRDSMT